MKIVFMGTPDFAAGILNALIEKGYGIVACVTQPDKPRGRKKEILPGPVSAVARERGIPLYQPLKMKDPDFRKALSNLRPDLIVVAAYGRIIPREILDLPSYGCINVHASLLPAWRGASPIQHMILAGDTVGGVSIMRMDEGLDTGDIIDVRETEIGPKETGGSLFDRLMVEGAALLCETIPRICDGTAVYTPQPAESTTPYASMITKESGRIDWSSDAAQVERMVRAYDPWPGAFSFLSGKRIRIWEAEALPATKHLRPGEILVGEGRELYAGCGGSTLKILELQAEGKKRMKAADFLNGIRTVPSSFEG